MRTWRARLRELAVQCRRFGYRRLHILAICEGLLMNRKKLRRLYRVEGLQVLPSGGGEIQTTRGHESKTTSGCYGQTAAMR